MNRFRFAVQATVGVDNGNSWRTLARKAESLGFSTLFIPDHLDDGQLSPIVSMTAAAMATSTLRVGSLLFNNDLRHPVLLAKEMSTLDLISEGRLEVGIGAGWKRTDYDQTGILLERPGARIERLSESIQVVKSLWTTGSCTFSGEYYKIFESVGLPLPFRPSGPPLIVGGGGKKILTLAAMQADIVGINPSLASGVVGEDLKDTVGPERFKERLDWVREAAGERFSELELQCLTFVAHVSNDSSKWISDLAPEFGVSPEFAKSIPIVLAGSISEVIETIEERRETYGFSYWVIHQHEMDSFAPVVEALSGK